MKKLDHLEHLREIADQSLSKMDLTPAQKQQVRERAASMPHSKKKYWWTALPAVAAAVTLAVTIPLAVQQPGRNDMVDTSPFPDSTGKELLGCVDLMENITPALAGQGSTESVSAATPLNDRTKEDSQKTADSQALADFSVELFRENLDASRNTLLSPCSAALALGMTANGASGSTLTEFLEVLGNGTLSLDQLNQTCADWVKALQVKGEGSILHTANSIWFRTGFPVETGFLQTNANYFSADAYQLDFNRPTAPDTINQWVSQRTGGKITDMVEKIDPDVMMYLLNTLYLEMDWETPFEAAETRKEEFHTADGKTVSVDFMGGDDGVYVTGQNVQGIKKQYADERYSFLALLPNEGVSLDEYVSTLTGEEFLSLARQKMSDPLPADGSGEETGRSVSYRLPKFRYSYGVQLKESLQKLGMQAAFDGGRADFSNLSRSAREQGLFIGQVLQKTFIEVDELGTKAGAATLVEVKKESSSLTDHWLQFDRPFLYAIVDNDTGLPLFLGTVTNPA